jgi:hypothetical protein
LPLFNYAKWVAKEVTDPKKNIDKKIFVVGPAGAGKSMTGLALATAISKWIAYYVKERFDKDTKPEDYFTFDDDHVAIINTLDLIKLMVKKLPKYSIKIVDDCGASEGFTARRSMSKANMDLISIYGTNRTDNTITIICVQDTTFTDKRMRMLANEVIDLTAYYQLGPIRIGKLYKIKMDNKSKYGIRMCRFMTYENSQWVTQESIACMLPTDTIKVLYDDKRKVKQDEQSMSILDTYTKTIEEKAQAKKDMDNRPKCPGCNSVSIYKRERTHDMKCRTCGCIF